MKRWMVALVVATSACADPSEPLYVRTPSGPVELSAGLFRLTTGPQLDYARAVLDDGTVLFVSSALPGAADSFGMAIADPAGGPARRINSVYQVGFPNQRIWTYVPGTTRPILFSLMHTRARYQWCGLEDSDGAPAPPRPPFGGWHLNVLPATDGQAVTDLARPSREIPVFQSNAVNVTGRPLGPKRMREIPPMSEADELGANPFGPSVSTDERYAYVSDGVVVWRYDLADSAGPADSITDGAYPVLARDDATLFLARTTVTDSTATFSRFVYLDWICDQTYVEYTWDDWQVVRRDLATGVEDTVGVGAEPALLGTDRLVVRRPGGLYVLSLSDGSADLLVADPTATSPAVAPDGSALAFTSRAFGNPDIFLLRLR